MIEKNDHIEDSGYFRMSDFYFSDSFSDYEMLYSSPDSVSEIYTAVKGFKRFVIKALKPEYRNDPLYVAQLRKEFEIGYLTDHPLISKYYSFENLEEKGPCIVREWIDGVPLEKYLQGKKHDEKKIIRLIVELCDALAYLHLRQTVHSDIKPSNILITNEGEHIKLIDFGFSDSSSFVNLKLYGGTNRYASPEQKGETQYPITGKTDVYSLGKVIEELPLIKKRSLKNILRKMKSENPEERPDMRELKDFFSKYRGSRKTLLWIPISLVVVIILCVGLLPHKRPADEMNKEIVPLEEVVTVETNDKSPDIEKEEVSEKVKKNSYEEAKKKGDSDMSLKSLPGNDEKVSEEVPVVPVNTDKEKENNVKANENNVRYDVHPLEGVTYQLTLGKSEKYYHNSSDNDWKASVRKEMKVWMQDHINDDELKHRCIEIMENTMKKFEEGQTN